MYRISRLQGRGGAEGRTLTAAARRPPGDQGPLPKVRGEAGRRHPHHGDGLHRPRIRRRAGRGQACRRVHDLQLLHAGARPAVPARPVPARPCSLPPRRRWTRLSTRRPRRCTCRQARSRPRSSSAGPTAQPPASRRSTRRTLRPGTAACPGSTWWRPTLRRTRAACSRCAGPCPAPPPGGTPALPSVPRPTDALAPRPPAQAAIRSENPVLHLEHEVLYGETFNVPDECLSEDFTIPFGRAKVERSGARGARGPAPGEPALHTVLAATAQGPM